MKKISDLTETRVRLEPYRDEYGNIRMESIEFTARRRIRTIGNGLRFVHFIVDMIVFQLVISMVQFVLLLVNKTLMASVAEFMGLMLLIPLAFSYSLLYTFFENRFQRTPGKFITKAIVIDEYGNKPDLRTLLMRNFIRIVPFEILSCLADRGWHDTWSDTYVVAESELVEIRRLMEEEE
ncbi:MAG: hypothetical protein JWN78_311 [Bacteroidota bacterium]|nr:hypothetical protein [Bacteroidota bacterium]